MYIENLISNSGHYIAPFKLTGDLLVDSDSLKEIINYPFNLWVDESKSELLATSEI